METVVFVAFCTIYGLSVLGIILNIGEPRKPYTPTFAAMAVVMSALYIWGIWYLYVN